MELEVVEGYTYLGLLLTEHLDYQRMGKVVASSASRALGLLISKAKVLGGMQYKTFTKLYDSMVWATINYGAAIWGTCHIPAIHAVHNRAMRFFMGVRKYTPNSAVAGDMGWEPPVVRLWTNVSKFYKRSCDMNHNRLFYHVFKWANSKASSNKNNWNLRIHKKYRNLQLDHFIPIDNTFYMTFILSEVGSRVRQNFLREWQATLDDPNSKRGNGGNKLRLYRQFKTVYEVEPYIQSSLPWSHRRALALFRCGVAPLRVETGRYVNLPWNERVCFNCSDSVEDECHVLFHCPLYNDFTNVLLRKCADLCDNFTSLCDTAKFTFILSSPELFYMCAKTCKLVTTAKKYLIS